MKTLAVLSPSLSKKINDESKYFLEIDDHSIPIGLINVEKDTFDRQKNENNNKVFVRKKSFSLNYRDLGVIEQAWNYLKKDSFNDDYYPIGSDFSGEIEVIGNDVIGFKFKDKIIGDSSYPFSKNDTRPGIPSNNSSLEYEKFRYEKLKKIPNNISLISAGGLNIGIQTSISMIKKAAIKPNLNILITAPSSNTSLFLLLFLKSLDCNIYCMSYSEANVSLVKNRFSFIKENFIFKNKDIPENLKFDVVFDPFSDTYLPFLLKHLNLFARYITCGIFNQSTKKHKLAQTHNMGYILGEILAKNISLIGNCLGSSEDLQFGLKELTKIQDYSSILIDSVYTEKDYIGDFIEKSFNIQKRLGKVIYSFD